MAKILRDNIDKLAVYQPGKPIEEVQRELGLEEVIKLASNENPLGPSPRAVEAIKKAALNSNLYPDGSCYRLRHALADFLGVDDDMILIGNGSNEIIQLLSLTFINPGDETIMPVPSFPRYEPLTRLMNGIPHEVKLKDFENGLKMDLSAMASYINEKTKIIYICNPNNPTGVIASKKELDDFLAKVPPGTLVVFDEAYCEYVDDEDYPNGLDYLASGRNVIVLRTFSKIYGLAGLRVGYGVGRPDVIAYLNRVREPFNVNAVAQEAALAALEDREYVQKVREVNREGKEYLYAGFDRLRLQYVPTQANFIFVNVERDEKEIFEKLLRKGIIVRGGFGYRTWLRVTIGTLEQNKTLLAALEEVLNE